MRRGGRWLWIGLLAAGTASFLFIPATAEQEGREGAPDADDVPPELVIRTYDVRDFGQPMNSFPYTSCAKPPTSMLEPRRDFLSLGDPKRPGMDPPPREYDPLPRGLQWELEDAITSAVDPLSWPPNSDEAAIEYVGGVFVIRQTAENHRKITALLESLRSSRLRLVTLQARWVLFGDQQVDQVLRRTEAGPSAPQIVDEAALRKSGAEVPYQGRTTCFAGQLVHLASGRAHTVVLEVEPVVSEYVAVLTPIVKMVQWGAVLEVRPLLSPDGKEAIVNISSVVSEPRSPDDRPLKELIPPGGKVILNPVKGLESLDCDIQILCTTIKVPLGEPVLVGGMTGSGKHEGKRLYLIVQVGASK